MIDAPDYCGSFLVDNPVILILRVLFVAIDGMGGSVFPRGALDFVGGRYLPGLIPQIPLVHNVQERGKLIAVLILAVHAVGDGNKMNPMLTKEYLGVEARLQIVPACPAHVLHNHPADLSGFNVGNHALPIGTLKVAAGPAIVRIVGDVGVAVLGCIVFEVCFLIQNGVAVAREIIVTGQALVQRRNLFLSLFHAHDALLSD